MSQSKKFCYLDNNATTRVAPEVVERISALIMATKDHVPSSPDARLLIDGEWTDASHGKTFNTIDPATEAVSGIVARASADDVDRAAQAARRAFDDGRWAGMAASKRARILWRAADLVRERADDLA